MLQLNPMSIIACILCLLLVNSNLNGQVVYEPVQSSVYQYLDKLSAKGITGFSQVMRPVTRQIIGRYLFEARNDARKLTLIEDDLLRMYEDDFFDEIQQASGKAQQNRNQIFSVESTERWRVFQYRDTLFSMQVDPLIGLQANVQYGKNGVHRWGGADIFGSVGKHIGYRLSFSDHFENGEGMNVDKTLTPENGINLVKKSGNAIEYDDVNAAISYAWHCGDITLAKEYLQWGSGLDGQIILSQKAPSFPMVRLSLRPVDWFEFTYFHGWLHSQVVDSLQIQHTLVPGRLSFSPVPKYIAAHMFTIHFNINTQVSLGESVVYSGDFNPLYLIPVMFFRMADHYMQDTDNRSNSSSGANAQLFFDCNIRVPSLKSRFYFTAFVDELSIEQLVKNEPFSSSVAYTLGMNTADPFWKDSYCILEISRIGHFVYMNSDPVQDYANRGYQLGHWLGSNAENISMYFKQYFSSRISAALQIRLTRKGGEDSIAVHYQNKNNDKILSGLTRGEQNCSVTLQYEFAHTLKLNLSYVYSNITDEDVNRSQSISLGKHHGLGLGVSYGR